MTVTTSMVQEVLENGSLMLVRQPIFQTAFRQPIGYEVLCRWPGNRYSPDEFIPVMEACGLGKELTIYVLDRLAKILKKKEKTHYWVNVPPDVLEEDPTWIIETLSETGSIHIELTERGELGKRGLEHVGVMKREGIKIFADDFAIDTKNDRNIELFSGIKIDRKIIRDYGVSQGSRHFLNNLVKEARSMGLLTIAEGIEREEDMKIPFKLGIDYVQGYLLGMPETLVV